MRKLSIVESKSSMFIRKKRNQRSLSIVMKIMKE